MLFGTGVVIVRQEVVAVPDGLDEDENTPQRCRDDGYEERLAAALGADAGRDREVGEHERDDREHDQCRKFPARPIDAKRLLAVGDHLCMVHRCEHRSDERRNAAHEQPGLFADGGGEHEQSCGFERGECHPVVDEMCHGHLYRVDRNPGGM